MSYKATAWAWEQEGLDSVKKIVLLAMADCASDTGLSFPQRATVCQMTGIAKEDTVSAAQDELVKEGRIADTGRRVGKTGRVRVFQFPAAACKSPPANNPLGGSLNHPSGGCLGGVKSPANHPRITRQAGDCQQPPNIKGLTGNLEASGASPPTGNETLRNFTDCWAGEYLSHFGYAYKFQGAKDAKAALELLRNVSAAELITVAKDAWKRPGDFNCKQAVSIAGFACRFNEIRSEVQQAKAKPSGQVPFRDYIP